MGLVLQGVRHDAPQCTAAAAFDTDDERSSFVVRLPVHPLARQKTLATAEVTAQVTAEVDRLLRVLEGDMSRADLQAALGLKHAEHFRQAYLLPALAQGWVEMTMPDKPNSRSQRYRLTASGIRRASRRGSGHGA